MVLSKVISEKMSAVARVPPIRHRDKASRGANQPLPPSSRGETNAALPGEEGGVIAWIDRGIKIIIKDGLSDCED